MFNLFTKKQKNSPELVQSTLFDEKSFYQAFIDDLSRCKEEVIIESPFITTSRMDMFYPVFETLIKQNVKVVVFTRDPREHTSPYNEQAEKAIQWFEQIGVQTFICTGNHHRKLALLDRSILYEGSLNILSQTHSREMMRRIHNQRLTQEMFDFIEYDRYL